MSEDKQHITDDLLVKYLLGETDAGESRQAELWISENETNRKYFEDFKLIWQQSEQLAAVNNPDEDAAWLRLQKRMRQTGAQPAKVLRPKAKNQWLMIAASVVLISFIGYLAFNRYKITVIDKVSGEQTLVENLPDGSSVILNRNSQLKYPSR